MYTLADRIARALPALICAAVLFAAVPAGASGPTAPKQRLVLQVSDDNPKTWTQALNVVRNVRSEYGKDNVQIEVVVFGHGIGMLKMDSPLADRVKATIDGGVPVLACQNTMKGYKIAKEDMLPFIGYTKAGIIEIMKKQQEGWVYARP